MTTPSSTSVWDRITAISAAIAALGLILAWGQIHELREEAKIQHLVEFIHDFDGQARSLNRKQLALKRIDKGQKRLYQLDVKNAPNELIDELNFCEDLGLFTQRGYLNRQDVWNDFGYWLFTIYADARPYLDAEQKEDKAEFANCTGLVESIRPIEIRESNGAEDHPSEDDIYREYLGELDSQPGESPRGDRHPKK